jgi:hypothetical protein
MSKYLLQATAVDGLSTPLVIIFLAVGIIIYFLPGLIARKKSNATAIALFNFFLGWTVLGWIIALVWAVSPDKPPVVYYNNKTEPSKSDELTKFKKLLDDGVITQAEFETQKNKILNQ